MRYLLLIATIAVLTISTSGQSVQHEFSDVPIWIEGKLPPDEISDRYYVYHDIRSRDYVLYYPEQFVSGAPSERRITQRIELQNLVDPTVRVSIESIAESGLRYAYSLANGPQARHAIWQWSIVAQGDDDTVTLHHPEWSFYTGVVPRPNAAPQASLHTGPEARRQAHSGKFVDWTARTEKGRIARGASAGGFTATSDFRPGFTTAYFVGGPALRLPEALPEEVMNQLIPLLRPESNWKTIATIGPKFGPGVKDDWIAADWSYGIQRLINEGRLSADSEFVAEALSLVNVLAPGGEAPRTIRAEPQTPLEQEVAAGLRYSLSVR